MKRFLMRSSAGVDHYAIEDGKETRFQSVADVAPALERNKSMATHNDGYTPSRDLRRVASIPWAIGLKWKNEEGWWFMDAGHDPDVAKKLAAKLNDPEFRDLRTAEGRVSAAGGSLR